MGVSPQRLIRFVRWLASREDLDASVDEAAGGAPSAAAPRAGFLRRVMAREALPEAPDERPEPTPEKQQKGLFSWLLSREPLPEEPPPTAASHSTRGLVWLLAREPLPLDPPVAEATRREGVTLRWLLRRERLGEDGGPSPYPEPANGPDTGPHNSPANDASVGRDRDPANNAHTGGSGPAG